MAGRTEEPGSHFPISCSLATGSRALHFCLAYRVAMDLEVNFYSVLDGKITFDEESS